MNAARRQQTDAIPWSVNGPLMSDHRKFSLLFRLLHCLIPSNKYTNKLDKKILNSKTKIARPLRRSTGLHIPKESGLQFIKFMILSEHDDKKSELTFCFNFEPLSVIFFPFKFTFLCLCHFFVSCKFIASRHTKRKWGETDTRYITARELPLWVKNFFVKCRMPFTPRSLAVSRRKLPGISQGNFWILPSQRKEAKEIFKFYFAT